MVLYKFISDLSCLESIATGNVRFTPVHDLNDPSEMFVQFNEQKVYDSLEILRKNGYTLEDMDQLQSQAELLEVAFPDRADYFRNFGAVGQEQANAIIQLGVYEQMGYLHKMLTQTVEALYTSLGVWSLTDRINSLPMWAYYANNASGCVIVYTDLESIFPTRTNSVLNTLKRIEYSREELFLTFKSDSHIRLLFSKLSDWSNESEYRVIKPLSECVLYGNLHLSTISTEHVQTIIFGWRTSIEHRARCIAAVKKVNPKIAFAEAYISDYNVEVRGIQAN